MKNIILLIISFSSLLMALFFGIIWANRLGLDYNSKGKYFDEVNSVVYDSNALMVYGLLTLVFALIGSVGGVIMGNKFYRFRS